VKKLHKYNILIGQKLQDEGLKRPRLFPLVYSFDFDLSICHTPGFTVEIGINKKNHRKIISEASKELDTNNIFHCGRKYMI